MPTALNELSKLDAHTFEHLVNSLALRVLGAGATGFGPGADGGRDGIYQGRAPYPSERSNWTGQWCIQSKFMQLGTGANPQKWLLDQIKFELAEYSKGHSKRTWPDNWIIATNIEPSGTPQTGSFDKALELVKAARPKLAKRFHIWGGRKILDFLSQNSDVAAYYSEFLTPGQVLAHLHRQIGDATAPVDEIVRYLLVSQLEAHQFTRLEQAGSNADSRPGIHKLFSDVPFQMLDRQFDGMAAAQLSSACAENHRVASGPASGDAWRLWRTDPTRSRIWFIKGGPGHGKSTLTQYLCQIQRAALILDSTSLTVLPRQSELCNEIKQAATKFNLWPLVPRIPFAIELKEFAQWYARRNADQTTHALGFLSEWLAKKIGQPVHVGTLRRALSSGRWLFIFDGLDEVPGDVKDKIAAEVIQFVNETLVGANSDCLVICTTRPQGYSGQFGMLEAATIELSPLSPEQALNCAIPVLQVDRSQVEAARYLEILREAMNSTTIKEIMQTPLQAHIMAVVVRDGGRPPERKWQLFSNFYQTIKKREINKNLSDKRIAVLLQQEDQLLKSLHTKLGFKLHARAETSQNAVTALSRDELEVLVREVVTQLKDRDVEDYVDVLMEATTERLLLVSTPDAGTEVRFDIRPLQEFFAAEYLYETEKIDVLVERLQILVGDSHWREVLHFLFSGLVESGRKGELATCIDVLIEANNGSDNFELRPLSRRFAYGSAIGFRLLSEGVLEQDKRVRAQFREALLPLLASTQGKSIIHGKIPRHSHEWLTEVFVETVREYTETECIGAAIAAVHIVGSHPRSIVLSDFIVQASKGFQRCLFEAISLEAIDEKSIPKWLIRTILQILAQPNWYELEFRALQRAFSILAYNDSEVIEQAIDIGLPTTVAAVLPSIFNERHGLPDAETQIENLFGVVEIEYTATPTLDWKSWSKRVWSDLGTSPGIFGCIHSALTLARSKRSMDKQKLIKHLAGRRLVCLPSAVTAYFSDNAIWYSLDHSSIRSILQERYSGCERMIMVSQLPHSQVDWAGFFKDSPLFALDLACDTVAFTRDDFRNFVSTREGAKLFLAATRIGIDNLFNHVALWAELFNLPEVGDELRRNMLNRAKQPLGIDSFYFTGKPKESFALDMPREVGFLPHIAKRMYDATAAEHQYALDMDSVTSSRADRMGKIAERYVAQADDLIAVRDDCEMPLAVRAAATAILMIHPHRARNSTLEADDLVAMYEVQFGAIFVGFVAVAYTDGIKKGDRFAMEVISRLIEQTREDYRARSILDEIIEEWREAARAPVNSSAPTLWV